MSDFFSLDIGSDTIKLIQLKKEKDKFQLVSAGICVNPLNGFISDSEKEMVPLAEAIKNLKKEARVNVDFVSASLQERNIFTQTIEVPQMSESELQQAIGWEAESVIPKPISEVNFDWKIIKDDKINRKGKQKVLIVAAPLSLIRGYTKVCKMAGLDPLSFESESLALCRSLQDVFKDQSAMSFNWGKKSAEITIFKKGDFYLNRSLSGTGEALTRAVSVGLGLDIPSAEEYKKTYGLSDELEGKVGKSLQPILGSLTNEIRKAINYYEEKEQEKLKLMVLSGGSSLLTGAIEYFTKSLGVEIQLYNPFSSVEAPAEYINQLKRNVHLYTIALGLSKKEF